MKTLSNAGNPQYPEIPQCKNAQVETISRVELAWLAGIIDGEGCMNLCWNAKRPQMKAEINITNSDARIIARVSQIYHKENIKFHYTLRKRTRFCLSICISGFRSCKKLLDMITPYLTGKRDQADTMAEYLKYRINLFSSTKDQRRAGNGLFVRTPELQYDEKDQYYMNKLKELKTPPINPQRLQRRASQPLHLG